MTYSIIGRDPATRELGIAVQSRFFAAGRIVPWIEAGVGAIASQAFANPAYGVEGLMLLRAGAAPQEALDRIKASDVSSDLRQVGMLDAQGRAAVFTGARCVEAAGHVVGAYCIAQANMMARNTVWNAMVAAFDSTEAALADKLLAALKAAEHEGGDIRGAQAAALIVVADKSGLEGDRLIDLRTDDHPDPVGEIARLLAYSRAHQRVMNATAEMTSDPAGALSDIEAALEEFPDDSEFLGRRVMALMANGRLADLQNAIAHANAANPNGREFLLRLADAGIIPVGRQILVHLLPTSEAN